MKALSRLQPGSLPTRIVLELLVGTAMSFFIMILWYIFQPISIGIINFLKTLAQDMGHYNSFVSGGITLLTYIVYWWGPILLASIAVIWLFVATQRRDWESRYE